MGDIQRVVSEIRKNTKPQKSLGTITEATETTKKQKEFVSHELNPHGNIVRTIRKCRKIS